MNQFITENQYSIPIVEGWREIIKSNWRNAYKEFTFDNIDLTTILKLKKDINESVHWLSKYGYSIEGKKIMDAGCYLGIQCFGAVEMGAAEAIGIDIPEYYINQSLNSNVNASEILKQRRDSVRKYHNIDQDAVKFYDMSIFDMPFENEFDFIFTWETFEHIINPKKALSEIHKALKPGGISFNLYNPFFSITGGHSMCTLDYPFSHVMLSDNDFKKYTNTIIPSNCPEKYQELSYNFFTKNLNRMTINDLKSYIEENDFELIDFITIPDLKVLQAIDETTLEICKELYPNITLNDLLCSNIYFIIKKI